MVSEADERREFEKLAEPHIDALVRTAERLTKRTTDAEDLVQEALLKGFRFFDRFERGTNFKAWIFTILMNAFVNSYRSHRRRNIASSADLEDEVAAPTPTDSADQPTFRRRETAILDLVDDRIRHALMELPESLRIVFMLSAVEDLKYREIADILDCPVGTVMSRLFRARAILKERLLGFAEDEGIRPEDDPPTK